MGNDLTADVLVRRAINLGVDRQEMIDNVLNGYGTPAYSVCDKLPWYNPASQVEYDPDAAAALLDEAGWRMADGGVRVKPWRPTWPISSGSWASRPPSRGWAGTPPMTGPGPSP